MISEADISSESETQFSILKPNEISEESMLFTIKKNQTQVKIKDLSQQRLTRLFFFFLITIF